MSNSVLRRRMVGGKSEETFKIEHSDHWYFEINTTSNNVWYPVFYATIGASYYLDGTLMPADCEKYQNTFLNIKIPTAGYHKIWIRPDGGWYNNTDMYRPFGNTKVVFLNTYLRFVKDATGSVHTLYINKPNPTSELDLTKLTKVQNIYVPKEYMSDYKRVFPTLANKVKPCKFI
jgi:hypothetical protein